jgi:D-cysteine desulfhydrase
MVDAARDWQGPLQRRFGRLIERLRPLRLADLPTPVQRLSRLGAAVGHEALYIKRDDLTSGLYGGNKPRKLEFLLADALRRGARTLVTMGALGSNHLLATAIHGRAAGMRTVGVVFPQPLTEHVQRNLWADRAVGVELVRTPSKYLLPAAVAQTMLRLRRAEGRAPALIPGGGSNALGALGFVNAGLELAAQVAAGELPEPEAVFVALGTGGTAAGLSLGLRLAGLRSRVVAVRVIDRLLANRWRMLGRLGAVARLCHGSSDEPVPRRLGDNLQIEHGFIGGGYGEPTPEGEAAMRLFAGEEGLLLEPTYTAKTAAAFLARARETRGPLLYWHTLSSADLENLVQAGRAQGESERNP